MRKLVCIMLFLVCLTANVGQAQFNDTEPIFGQQLNLGHWSTDGLVFYWRGIQAGNVVDESFYGNHGTITGATWVGGALDFSGATQYVAVPHSPELSLPDAFTLCSRFEVDALPGLDGWTAFIAQGTSQADNSNLNHNYALVLEDDIFGVGPAITLIYENDAGTNYMARFATTLTLGRRYFMTGTFNTNTNTLRLYLDGVLVAEETGATGVPDTTTLDIVMGRPQSDGHTGDAEYLNGRIFENAIYNRTLSASEIAALYINPDLPMQHEPIWLIYSPSVGMDIGALMQATREDKTGGKQSKTGGKQ